MSDLTDNWFYFSAKRIWLCIRLNNGGKWACDRLTENADFGKKIFFSYEAHFDRGGYVCFLENKLSKIFFLEMLKKRANLANGMAAYE